MTISNNLLLGSAISDFESLIAFFGGISQTIWAFKNPITYKTVVDGLREKKEGTCQPTPLTTIVAINMTSFNPQFYFVQVQTSGKPWMATGLAMGASNLQLTSSPTRSCRKIRQIRQICASLWQAADQSPVSLETMGTRQRFSSERNWQSNWLAVFFKKTTSSSKCISTLVATIRLGPNTLLMVTAIRSK